MSERYRPMAGDVVRWPVGSGEVWSLAPSGCAWVIPEGMSDAQCVREADLTLVRRPTRTDEELVDRRPTEHDIPLDLTPEARP